MVYRSEGQKMEEGREQRKTKSRGGEGEVVERGGEGRGARERISLISQYSE